VRLGAAALIAGAWCVLSGVPAAAEGEDVVATIRDERITESSGLVQSGLDADLAYTVNDSGSGPVVYVIELSSGEVVGTATLGGIQVTDVEALALGADERLYVADIGDNDGARPRVDIYVIDQPAEGDVTVTPERHPVRYADGPRDAESLVSDVLDGSFYVVTKGLLGGELYRLDPLRPDRVTVARPVDDVEIPGVATDADVLSAGDGVVVRTYSDAYVFAVPGWELLTSFPLPEQPQGETVAAIDGGPSFYIGSEGQPSDLLSQEVPAAAWRELGRRQEERRAQEREPHEADEGASPDNGVRDGSPGTPWLLGGGVVMMLLLIGGAVALVARRRT
jgi:hypothetical protein